MVVDVGGSGCLPGQFLCGDGKCVDRSAICNGYYDCIDAADERDCSEFHFIAHSETLNNVFEFNPLHLRNRTNQSPYSNNHFQFTTLLDNQFLNM